MITNEWLDNEIREYRKLANGGYGPLPVRNKARMMAEALAELLGLRAKSAEEKPE